MTRRVTIGVTERADIVWMAFHLGRVMLLNDQQGKQAASERRQDTQLLRKLKAASAPAPETSDKLQSGEDQRTFTLDATIDLSQPELDRLVQCLDRVGWTTSKLEAVEDTRDWLMAAVEVKE